MKLSKLLIGASIGASLAICASAAFAHGHVRSHVFIGVGPGWGWGPGWWYEPPPVYYYPPRIEYVEPPVYIEQNAAPEAENENGNYWYYCPESRKYYPYAKECPRGWQRVIPTPPDAH